MSSASQQHRWSGRAPSSAPSCSWSSSSSTLSSLGLTLLCRKVMCPDPLLAEFRTPSSNAAHALNRFIVDSVSRNNIMLSELESDHSSEEIGMAVERLADACHDYVARFSKRMELLQRYSSETTERSNLGARSWSQRVQDYYHRPFATLQGRVVFGFQVLVMFGALLSMTLQTVPALNPRIDKSMDSVWIPMEAVISVLFLVDVVVLFFANVLDPERSTLQSLKIFFTSLSNCLDVAAMVLPTIQVLNGDTAATNAFILFRLLRMYRLMSALRHFYAFEDLFDTLASAALPLLGPVIAVLMFVVAFASMVFTMEQGSYDASTYRFLTRNDDCEQSAGYLLGRIPCPRQESKFLSIFHTMWFSLIALLTIGYGDLVPITMEGRAISLVCIVLGQLLMAMPIAIIGNRFTKVVARLKAERRAVNRFIAMRSEDLAMEDIRRSLMQQPNGGGSVVSTAAMVVSSGADVGSDASEPTHGTGPAATTDDKKTSAGGRPQRKHSTTGAGDDRSISRSASSRRRGVSSTTTVQRVVERRTRNHGQPALQGKASLLPQETVQDTWGDLRRQTIPTQPSLMFCRFLQYALKQRTLNFNSCDRSVHYAVEMYLRHCAKMYLEVVDSMLNDAADDNEPPASAPAASSDGGARGARDAETTSAQRRSRRSQLHRPLLTLVHADICYSLLLPRESTILVGSDPSADVPIGSSTYVVGQMMVLYHNTDTGSSSKHRNQEQKRSGAVVGDFRLGGGAADDSQSIASFLSQWTGDATSAATGDPVSGLLTPTQHALRQSYAIAPEHCVVRYRGDPGGDTLRDVTVVERLPGREVFVNGRPMGATQTDLMSSSVFSCSLVQHAPQCVVSFGLPLERVVCL